MSTARFALVWGALEAGGRVAVLFVIRSAMREAVWPSLWVHAVVFAVGPGLMDGVTGSWALRICRKPVRGWGAAVLAGTLVTGLLAFWVANGLILNSFGGGWSTVPLWMTHASVLVAGANRGLILGGAEALALWRRSWPSTWRLWMAGRVGVSVLAAAVSYGISWLIPDSMGGGVYFKAVQWGAYGLVEGAGRAWLIDRCHFKREAEAAPAA